MTKNSILSILTIVFFLLSCSSNNNTKPFNPQKQKEFAKSWLNKLDAFESAKTSYDKDRIADGFKSQCSNKEISNWIGQLKDKNSFNGGKDIRLHISQMFVYNDPTEMTYYLCVSNESPAYKIAQNIAINDTVRFSGVMLHESSFTNSGMMKEPEISVECNLLNNVECFSPDKAAETNDDGDTFFQKCAGCGKTYDHNGYFGGPGKGKPYGALSHQYRSKSNRNLSGGYCSQTCSMKYSK